MSFYQFPYFKDLANLENYLHYTLKIKYGNLQSLP